MVQVINTIFPVKAFAESRIGGRQENQDTCAWTDTPVGFLLLVCDGMGGGPGGKTASMIAAKVISDHLKGVKRGYEATEALAVAIDLANAAILAATGSDYPAVNGKEYTPAEILPEGIKPQPKLKGMGSTVAAVLITNAHAIVAHIGDSRVYQLRKNKIVYRSTDHSHVMELVKNHVIDEEQARLSGESNIITQALGHGTGPLKSEVTILPYLKGDRFVLCSDGIWGMFPQKKLIEMIASSTNGAGAVDSVVVSVDNEGSSNGGGHDNLTLAIADVTANSKDPVKMTKFQKIIMYGLAVIAGLSIILNLIQWHYRPSTPESIVTVQYDTIVKTQVKEVTVPIPAPSADTQFDEIEQETEALRAQLDSIASQIDSLKKISNLTERSKRAKEIAKSLDAIIPDLKAHNLPQDKIKWVSDELKKDKVISRANQSDGQIKAANDTLNNVISRIFSNK